MASLTGKVALITGGSKGIGAALALKLAELGATVAINYSSDSSAADATVAQINKTSQGLAIKADASTVDGVSSLVDQVVQKFQKIDILVPMAGIMMMKTLGSTTEHDFDLSYALNVKGPYFLAQKAAPHMPSGSTIIFISTSVNTLSGVSPGYLLYCSTKGAIEQMTRVMSKELGAKNINVNCIAPGPTATELFYKGKSEQVVNAIAGMNPHNRIGKPEEIAGMISLLCESSASWVNGQVLRVNGGMTF